MSLHNLIDTDLLQTFGEGTIVPLKGAVGTLAADIAVVETSPTTAAHAQGDLLIYGGVLYKAKTAIAVGATLTVNTNIEATTVATEVKNSGSAITVDSELSTTSENPVQNKVITSALSGKVDVVSGKQLSTEDYTTAEKTKLAGLSADDMDCLKNMLYPHIIVTGTANTAFTLTKGTRTISGTVGSGGTAEVLVPEIGAWTLTMGGTTKYYFVTAPMTYNDEAIAVSTTLADNTPETIQKVAQAGMASNFWSVGDKIGIAMSGTVGSLSISGTYYAFILGFDHNASIEGSNSIHFALGMTSGGKKIAFVDSSYNTQISTNGFNMNTSNTNSGGWNGSQMRTNIMPAIKNALPSAWRSVIKATTKYSDNTGGGNDTASYVTSTSDEIFLPAEFEVHGARTYANSAEQNKQKQYDYFKNGNSKICYKHNATSSACGWWCRSVIATNNSAFLDVNTGGNANVTSANTSRGVFSGFRVA